MARVMASVPPSETPPVSEYAKTCARQARRVRPRRATSPDGAGVQGRDKVDGEVLACGRGALVVDRTQPLVAGPGDSDLPVRVADLERCLEADDLTTR